MTKKHETPTLILKDSSPFSDKFLECFIGFLLSEEGPSSPMPELKKTITVKSKLNQTNSLSTDPLDIIVDGQYPDTKSPLLTPNKGAFW